MKTSQNYSKIIINLTKFIYGGFLKWERLKISSSKSLSKQSFDVDEDAF